MTEIKYEMGELTIDKVYVSQRLCSLNYGWGAVESIDLKQDYPIYMKFDSGKSIVYTDTLRENENDLTPDLFENEPIITVPAIKVTKTVPACAELIQDDQGNVYLGSIFSDKEELQRLSTSAKLSKNVLKIIEFDYDKEITEK